ncbi:hypothetical protein ACFQW6_09970 [Nocardioides sp. GCM10028917]|uniref:hypothetical protein n=1 Tax=Nocardioides sp. GCM10028917 TaxID=3273408 RepID=UPI003614FB56
MQKDEREATMQPEPLGRERRESPSAVRLTGVATLVLCALTLYFAAIAMYLDKTASSAIDQALASAVRIALGACAISGLVSGAFLLNWRDQAIMRAQQAARNSRETGD